MAKAKIKRLYLIPILSKALDVIELLEQDHAPLTLEDIYQQTNISKTSVYRILKTLVHRGYLAQTPSGQYRLVSRPRRLRFGFAVQSAEMPFSMAVAQSVTAAAAAAGVELMVLDNRYDPDVAVRNAEEFVAKRVDLVLEFQVEEAAAPRVAHIFKKADIPTGGDRRATPQCDLFWRGQLRGRIRGRVHPGAICAAAMEGQSGQGAGRRLQRSGQLCAEPHYRRL